MGIYVMLTKISPYAVKNLEKLKEREIAKKVGLPLLPGSDGPVDFQKALEVASTIGYPVVIKAAAGGGGRGIRVDIYFQGTKGPWPIQSHAPFCQCLPYHKR